MKKKTLTFNGKQNATKLSQLVEALSHAIGEGQFGEGMSLPSVNEISRQYQLSRDTVFKAYRELKKRGIVDSTPAKGYFVATAQTNILLMLDVYSPFKDVLYNSFVHSLPKNYKVDLVFHFYNQHLFETVIQDGIGRYNLFVIMNFSNESLHPALKRIDPSKLLLIDLGDFEKEGYSYIRQDFGESVRSCLKEQSSRILSYKKMILHLPAESEHPRILIQHFRKLGKELCIETEICTEFEKLQLKKKHLFFLIQQKDLVNMVKLCRSKGYIPGKDIGLLAYNDSPMYEIIGDGISVISTDFSLMGKKAAQFVISREPVFETIPARLILRGSF